MRRPPLASVRRCALAALLALSEAGALAAAPGAPAPAFELAGRDGAVSLAQYRGKFVYLDFWASWCAPCKRSFPFMGDLQQRYGAAGVQVVAVNVDAARVDAERFLAATPAAFVVAYDPQGSVAKLYAIKGMPSSVLIGPDGQVLRVHAGFNADTPASITAEIDAALAQHHP